MDKELEIAILISALITAGKNYNDKDIYSLYESQNIAEVGKRAYEALVSLGYCIKVIPLAGVEIESQLTTHEGE